MTFITSVFLLTVFFVLFSGLGHGIRKFQYTRKVQQMRELKQIYLYLEARSVNPVEADKKREKSIHVKNRWLYTKNFYFDLQDEKMQNRMAKYFLEYFAYFVAEKKQQDILDEIIDFGKTLHANKILVFNEKMIEQLLDRPVALA